MWAWGVAPEGLAAVLVANRVVAVSPEARRLGVKEGLRRREAQARCPELIVLDRDRDREARAFAPVVAAIEAFTPRVELTRPGVCAVLTHGPSRYFGGEEALAVAISVAVSAVLGRCCGVGVADGWFAAQLAARAVSDGQSPLVVPAGETEQFLAPLPLHSVERPELVEVLRRLGLVTLADLAQLPAADVLGRFGTEGVVAHRLARGLDERPLDARRPPADLLETLAVDPPVERVDQAAFLAKGMADRLHQRLGALGMACLRVLIEAESEHGEFSSRLWRHEGALTPGAMADRVRWQLEGWLSGPTAGRPTGGIVALRLVPQEVVPAKGRQLGFWGGQTQQAERAARSVARVQGLLGAQAVSVVERRGGRLPGEQLVLVSAATVDFELRPALPPLKAPWPGRLVQPPATVLPVPVRITVLDEEGAMVLVNGRGATSAAPTVVARPGGSALRVISWAGPWPVEGRWWDAAQHRRQARYQVVLSDGSAHLLAIEQGNWWLQGTYD